jgi:tRNA wybutosine-synthesizing protein 4
MATSNDALVTKVYSSGKGYFEDPYSKLFLSKQRKMYPIINRGTWARVHAYRQVILRFLNTFKESEQVNIVSLGCGYDSTFFWLCNSYPELSAKMCYIEIDYDQVVN